MRLVLLKLVNEAWFGLPICSHQGGWLNLMMTAGQQVNWTSIIQAQLLGQNDADGAGTSGKKTEIAQYVKKPQKQQGDSALFF